MSLRDARMPRLADKLEAVANEAEEKRDVLEDKDIKHEVIIKKASKKK